MGSLWYNKLEHLSLSATSALCLQARLGTYTFYMFFLIFIPFI